MRRDKGFTIVELMLAMAFVATLLVAVAMTVIQIGNTYNRGITFKNVNQVGRSMAAELQRSIAEGPAFNIASGGDSHYIVQDWGGRLCTSQYTYIWNYGKAVAAGDTTRLNTYADSAQIPRFIKVLDPSASYCADPAKKVPLNDAVELLNLGEYDLALHYFVISTAGSAADARTGQRLYSISFQLGTNNQKALTFDASSQAVCKLAGETDADPSYCSVSRFDIVTRAGNTVE